MGAADSSTWSSQGLGSPRVILEADYRNDADIWDTLALDPASETTVDLLGVAAFTHVCAYDRPGTLLDATHFSLSDPASMQLMAASWLRMSHVSASGC